MIDESHTECYDTTKDENWQSFDLDTDDDTIMTYAIYK
jgi:hypothetical protein